MIQLHRFRSLFVITLLGTAAAIILFTGWLLWPEARRYRIWTQYTREPYSQERFLKHMALIGQEPTKRFGEWYINGVYRARRNGHGPLWVIEIYHGHKGGFTLGCLVVLDSDGRHLRTIEDERINWILVAPKSDWRQIQAETNAKRIVDLPDLTGDSWSEIPTQRWRPFAPGIQSPGSLSIFRTDDDSIPRTFCIEFYHRWPADGLPMGDLRLYFDSERDGSLGLDTPISTEAGGRFFFDHSQPPRNMARFTWSAETKTFVGPAEGPNGVWVVLHDVD